jgi:hypothetical protein
MKRGKKSSKKKTKRSAIIVALIIVIIALIIYGLSTSKPKHVAVQNEPDKTNFENDTVFQEEPKQEEKSDIKIFNGTDRPIAFMIDNNKNAQPQASINSTYMVYEIIVEGGETRLMALFKGKDADQVGPIRSSRHYFLDYAMENDAIYAHLGMSPQAAEAINQFGINNINGQAYDTGKARTDSALYWRATHKKAPHNAYTNIKSISQIAQSKGYKTTSDKKSVLNYVAEEVNLDVASAVVANEVTIPYTSSHKVKYVYNEQTKRYTRYSKGKKMSDEMSKDDITTKNIIVTFAENYTLNDGEDKGRQDVVTVGNLDGYYITNGKAIKIKCKKESRETQTKYVDLEGNEINVNDGNTWVNVCPTDSNVVIE